MPVGRVRDRDLVFLSGLIVPNNGSPPSSNNVLRSHEHTEDVAQSRVDNNVFIRLFYNQSGGIVNGNSHPASTLVGNNFINYPINKDGFFTGHAPVTLESDSVFAARTLARSNPGRASVQGAVAIGELREIPGLLKHTLRERLDQMWETISRKKFGRLTVVARFHLLVQFGIVPVVSDIVKCGQFQSAVKQRSKELDRLTTRGLRRTIKLGVYSGTSSVTNYIPWSTSGRTYNIDATKVTKVTVTGHVRWYTNNWLAGLDHDSQRKLLFKAVSGMSIQPETVYELMPWSWLIDYFTNLGDIVKATNNVIPCTHDAVRIMRHYETEAVTTKATILGATNTLKITPLKGVVDDKYRVIAAPTLSAKTGLLNASQLSILASLSISR